MKCLRAPCTLPNCTWCSAKFLRARIRKGLNVAMYFANSALMAANTHTHNINHRQLSKFTYSPNLLPHSFSLSSLPSPPLPSSPPLLPPPHTPLLSSPFLSSLALLNSPSTSTPTVSTTSSCTPPLCPRLDWNIISSAVITVSAILRASVELTFRRRLCRVASRRDSRSVSCCRSAPDTCDCVWV